MFVTAPAYNMHMIWWQSYLKLMCKL